MTLNSRRSNVPHAWSSSTPEENRFHFIFSLARLSVDGLSTDVTKLDKRVKNLATQLKTRKDLLDQYNTFLNVRVHAVFSADKLVHVQF